MSQATMEENETQKKLDKLVFVKLKLPTLIPIDLIESVKGRTFTPDQFYEFQVQQLKNPHNHLHVLIDEQRKIHGYLWAEVNVLDNSLFINTFSISKEYWDKGQAIQKAIGLIRKIKEEIKCPRIFWITTNEKFFKKHGFQRSKNILMEYNLI